MLNIVRLDDWIGIYIDGGLVYEGHDIEETKLLDLAGVDEYTYEWLENWDSDLGRLPEDFEEIERYR